MPTVRVTANKFKHEVNLNMLIYVDRFLRPISLYNLKRLLVKGKSLTKLDLTGTRQFHEAHWHQMLSKTGKLTDLDLSVTNITGN